MSSAPYRPVLTPVLLTGETELPTDPDARALLFVECISHGLIAWEALLTFHIAHRATPIAWPRSFAESYPMLRLAVVMAEVFGEYAEFVEVTRTLAYHLFDRGHHHPELVAIIQDALPRGTFLLLPLLSRLPS